jgi:protein-tyrosine phosphatase
MYFFSCLDDEELELLGASWQVYLRSAQALGMDVLRLPVPEGLPPITPAYLDLHLSRLIQDYTLKGIHVLVHCRGGVGRAGVVACCWMARLGICGWVEENIGSDATECHPHGPAVLTFVNTVIGFLRKRRNPKAVETFEQVQFLVGYVEFLQGRNLD